MIGFSHVGGQDCLLLSEVHGKNLAELAGIWRPEDLVKELAQATREFHSLPIDTLFPGTTGNGFVVLHGDMAMPNVLYGGPGARGFIDLAQMKVGTADEDLADAIWSLQRNLGPGYGELFLQEYGHVTMTGRIEKALRFKYDRNN